MEEATVQPTSVDQELAESLWRGDTCLATDSIQFGNGAVALFAVEELRSTGKNKLKLHQMSTWLTVLSERIGNPLTDGILSWVTRMNAIEVEFAGQQLQIECGEGGGNGSFGYVAVSSMDTEDSDELVWVAFFYDSSPFDELTLDGEVLHALTTCGWRYSFSLSNPTDVAVENRQDLMWWSKEI